MKTRADLLNVPGFHGLHVDTDGNPLVWASHYLCPECSGGETEWSGAWSCQCNDKCPVCGAETEPYDSEWIGPEQEALRALWSALPDAGSGYTWEHADRARRPSLTLSEVALIYGALSAGEPDERTAHLTEKFRKLLVEELNPSHRAMFDAYRAAVPTRDGELECDGDAEVSLGDDDGAYVMVWKWVYNHEVADMQAEAEDA